MAIARRSIRIVFLLAVMMVLAWSLLFGLTHAPRALAEERAPDAPGSIAGVVKNSLGEPQVAISVTLYKLASGYPYGWNPLRTTTTDANGTYRFPLLLVGVYRVGVIDITHVYAEGYYPAAPILAQGADIPVAGNQLNNIDLTLQPGSQITGQIATTNSVSATNLYVTLFRPIDAPYNTQWEVIQGVNLIGNHGIYSFTGLSATTYRVCAVAYNPNGTVSECYDNVYEVSRATDLTLQVGETKTNVDLVLGDGADYAQISGRVVSPINEPLAGIAVYATPALPWWPPIPLSSGALASVRAAALQRAEPVFPDFPYWNYGTLIAYTDNQGIYRFPTVAAGTYTVYFSDPAGQYTFEYYNNAQTVEAATPLELVPNQIITDINAQLTPGGRIVGTLTILGQPATNATVEVTQKTLSGWNFVGRWKTDTNTGRYMIGGLPPGTYRLFANGVIKDVNTSYNYYYYGFFGNFGGSMPETATDIILTEGATVQADIVLSGDRRFEGSLSGRITAGGAPLVGAKVSLYPPGDAACCYFPLPDPLAYVVTDAEGRYTIAGLTSSIVRIGVADPTGIYATTYYTSHILPAFSNPVTVEEGKATTDINVDLPLAGAIQGRVTLRNGKAVAGLYVTTYMSTLYSPNYSTLR